jgi:hypothetical protein
LELHIRAEQLIPIVIVERFQAGGFDDPFALDDVEHAIPDAGDMCLDSGPDLAIEDFDQNRRLVGCQHLGHPLDGCGLVSFDVELNRLDRLTSVTK